jgi:hypothetical protein
MSYRLSFVFWGALVPIGMIVSTILLFMYTQGTFCFLYVFIPFFLLYYIFSSFTNRLLRSSPRVRCDQNKYRTVIGGGWSFFLKKEHSSCNIIFDTSGKLDGDWWKAGTSIQSVQKVLKKRGKTLASHPSVKTSTLGGWIFSNSHGSGGTLWTPQFSKVKVLDQDTQTLIVGSPKQFFNAHMTIEQQRKYIIKEVKIKHVENVWTEQVAFKLQTLDDASTFLYSASHLRLAQIGARGTMCLLWKPITDTTQKLSSARSRLSTWFEADVLSAWQKNNNQKNWFDWPVQDASKGNTRVKLSDANDFSPAPISLFASFAFAYRNFELFVYTVVTPQSLMSTCKRLEEYLQNKGRCELRCGKKILFLDFGVAMSVSVTEIISEVRNLYKGAQILVHKGKANVDLKDQSSVAVV